MNNPKLSNTAKSERTWQIISFCCFLFYVLESMIFVFLGRLNADEGWYLYASRLVYEGKIPYQDFAYTQTPLLPYIYGLFQQVSVSSLYLGRITSVIFSCIAFYLSIQLAKKLKGNPAAALTSLLWATFIYGIYFQSITKTYALSLLFFSSTFYILLFEKNKERAKIVAAILVILASLTRLSALFFAIPVLSYAFATGSKRTKIILLALSMSAIACFCILALPNWPAAQWNILLHHTSKWKNISFAEKARRIVFSRLPLLFLIFPTHASLFLAMALFNFRNFYDFLRNNRIVCLILTSLLFFAAPNLASGEFYSEYFVPLLFSLFPILSAGIVQIWPNQTKVSKIFLQVMILSTFILGFLRGGREFVDISGGKLPIEEVKEIAYLIEANSNAKEQILALEGLSVAVESNRHTLPGMAMAQFSYLNVESEEAARYHLINDKMLLEAIIAKEPTFIILTDFDWKILETSDIYDILRDRILANYVFVNSWDSFGQGKDRITLYSRIND